MWLEAEIKGSEKILEYIKSVTEVLLLYPRRHTGYPAAAVAGVLLDRPVLAEVRAADSNGCFAVFRIRYTTQGPVIGVPGCA